MNEECQSCQEKEQLIAEMRNVLLRAEIQIEFLRSKLDVTGSRNMVLEMVREAIEKADTYLEAAAITPENGDSHQE